MDKIKQNLNDIGLLWLRVLMGLGMVYHGYGKVFGGNIDGFAQGVAAMGFPFPLFFAWAAALSEFLGGIFIMLGLFTRIASFLVFVTMFVAAFIKHGPDPFRAKELALAYWVIAGALIFTGAGKYSLDSWLQKGKK